MRSVIPLLAILAMLTVSLPCFANPGNDDLVPIRKGNFWGLADQKKNIVVPCEYDRFEYQSGYYALEKPKDDIAWSLYTSKGKLIGKAYAIQLRSTGSVLLDTVAAKEPDINNYFHYRNGTGSSYNLWTPLRPMKARQLVDGKLVPLDDYLLALTDVKPRLFIMLKNGKVGVYNSDESKYIIEPLYSSITNVPYGFFLATTADNKKKAFFLDGTEIPYKSKYDTENRIDTGALPLKKMAAGEISNMWFRNDNYRLIKTNAKTERKEPKKAPKYVTEYDSVRKVKVTREKKDPNYDRNFMKLIDTAGNTLISDISGADQITSDLYRIQRIHQAGRHGYSPGVFSISKKKIVFPFTDTTAQYDIKEALIVVKKNRVKSYYSPSGELLGVVADSTAQRQKEWNLFQVFRPEYNYHANNARIFYAIRSDTNEKYKVYNQEYRLLRNDYENLYKTTKERMTTFQKNGNWGLLDERFDEVIPPLYSEPLKFHDPYSTTSQANLLHVKDGDGRYYRAVSSDKVLFWKKDFSFVNEHVVNGRWLAIDYEYTPQKNVRSYPLVKAVYIIDSLGNKLYTWNCDDDRNTIYELTADLKIFCNPRNTEYETRPYMLYDPATKHSDTFGQPSEIMRYGNGIPLLLQVFSHDKKNKLYSIKDFKEVVLPRQYEFYRIKDVTINDDNAHRGFIITGVDKQNYEDFRDNQYKAALENFADPSKLSGEDETIIGFYNFEGILFN